MARPPYGGPAPGGRGVKTILVAEDERDVQELSAALLEREGYTVLRASDGQEAKEVFERNAAEIDLVLLDMVMPKADGREVYEHIRKLRVLHSPPQNVGLFRLPDVQDDDS